MLSPPTPLQVEASCALKFVEVSVKKVSCLLHRQCGTEIGQDPEVFPGSGDSLAGRWYVSMQW